MYHAIYAGELNMSAYFTAQELDEIEKIVEENESSDIEKMVDGITPEDFMGTAEFMKWLNSRTPSEFKVIKNDIKKQSSEVKPTEVKKNKVVELTMDEIEEVDGEAELDRLIDSFDDLTPEEFDRRLDKLNIDNVIPPLTPKKQIESPNLYQNQIDDDEIHIQYGPAKESWGMWLARNTLDIGVGVVVNLAAAIIQDANRSNKNR